MRRRPVKHRINLDLSKETETTARLLAFRDRRGLSLAAAIRELVRLAADAEAKTL